MHEKYSRYFYPIIVILFCSLPYLIVGYPLGHDSILGLTRVKEYQIALFHHQFPPYWADNLYGGYGSPIFLFYAPLYLFVSAIFYTLTGSIVAGSTISIFLFTVIGAIGIYFLVREILEEDSYINRFAAKISTYLFLLNPYLIGDKIVRNANSEYSALCVAPFALYGVIRIKKNPLEGSLLLAAGLCLSTLAHNLTALTVLAIVITLALSIYPLKIRKCSEWYFITGGIILGLLLSIFFWLPAISYKTLVHSEVLTQDYYNFYNNFQPLIKFFTYTEFTSLGVVSIWVIFQSYILLVNDHSAYVKEKSLILIKLGRTLLILALLFIFLQTKLSLFIWQNIPYLPLFQFPWRMMGPLALVNSALAGILASHFIKKKHNEYFKKIEFIIIIICILHTIPIFFPKAIIPNLTLTQLIPILEKNNYNNIIMTSTAADEYLPKSAKIILKQFTNDYSPIIINKTSDTKINIIKETGTEIFFETYSSKTSWLTFKRWFFPNWNYTVNGKAYQTHSDKNGLLLIEVPSGHNKISLELTPPLLRKNLLWVSMAALVLWTLLAAYSWQTQNRRL